MSKRDLSRWECATCHTDKFPFGDISNNDLVSMSFNSNYDCPCQSTCLTSILKRNEYRLDLFKHNKNKFYINADPFEELEQEEKINTNFEYYEDHEFHKLLKNQQFKSKTSFSLFHTNIQSVHNKLDTLFGLHMFKSFLSLYSRPSLT